MMNKTLCPQGAHEPEAMIGGMNRRVLFNAFTWCERGSAEHHNQVWFARGDQWVAGS